MRATWLSMLLLACAGPPAAAPQPGPGGDADTDAETGTPDDPPDADSGWPDEGTGWQAGLTLVLDGALVADGAVVPVDTAPAGLASPTTLRFTLTNRGEAAAELGAGTWLEGEAWAMEGTPPTSLAAGESAVFTAVLDPGAEPAATTRTATLQVPGGPSATLVATVPRPLRAVVVGSQGSVWTSDDYGATFSAAVPPDGSDHEARDVVYGGGRFFRADRAGGDWSDPGVYAWSEDGLEWHASTVAEDFWASRCAHGLGRFTCARGDAITWSTTGQTVVHQATSWAGHLNDITWAGDRFVAVGRSGRRAISLDGESWSAEHWMDGGDSLNAVAAGGGTLVAAGGADRLALSTSTDGGETWTDQVLCADRYARFEGLAHDGARWLASASSNACAELWTSTDGLAWTPIPDADADPYVLGVLQGVFVGVHAPWGQPQELVTSPDGRTWTVRATAPEGVALSAMATETWEAP